MPLRSWGLRWLWICMQWRRPRFDTLVWKIPWRREWQLTPLLLPGEFHGQTNLAGYSPWGHKESDMTEQLTLSQFHSVLGVLFPLPVSVPCLLLLLFDCYYSSLKNKKTGSQRLSNCLQTYQLLESGHDGSKALSKIPHHPLMKVPLPPCV